MQRFGRAVVKLRIPILILSFLLLIPSVIAYFRTGTNYDILAYLPKEIDTMRGQDILKEDFGTGAYAMYVCEGLEEKEVSALRKQIEKVDHVEKILWYDSIADLSVPMSVLPDKIYDVFNNEDATMMFVIFDTGTSEDETMEAIHEIRKIAGEGCYLGGMSSIVTDTKDLADKEVVIYVVIAVVLSIIVLSLTMDSFLLPFLFLLSIGMAIIYNMGTNLVFGEISYITKALAAVLQLGVTMDYSIFLWHSFREIKESEPDSKKAMAQAIAATLRSVIGSSVTTVAGFIALCFMTFTLGLDLGVVMAKGVLFGVLCCVTILPSLILVFEPLILKTTHRQFIKEFPKATDFILKHSRIFVLILAVGVLPAAWCEFHTDVYYKIDASLPEYLPSVTANAKLKEYFDMGAMHMILIDKTIPDKDADRMIEELEKVDGVKAVLGMESLVGPMIPDSFVPEKLKDIFTSDTQEMMIITNEYEVATDEVNAQCDRIEEIIHSYDPESLLVGEAPCTRDLINITNRDFTVVNAVSILLVFLIIFFVFGSISLPVLLIFVIEFAIFVNLGIPFLTGTVISFVASIVIGTIQLGATVDYAILMTGRYETERISGKSREEALWIAHRTSFRSIIVSALSFFSATIGVGLYSGIDIVSELCILMARGALISMAVVLLILPSVLSLFDGLIIRTSLRMRRAGISGRDKAEAVK